MPVLDAYARVSELYDEKQRSTSGQIKVVRRRIEQYGAVVGETLKDEGRSAWNQKVKRPDWDTLMHRLENGLSDGVCVFDLSRFSRRVLDGERLITAAERGLIVLDSEQAYDLATADGKVQFRDQLKMAAYYSDRLSSVVRRGMKEKAEDGEPSRRWRTFGFEPDAVTLRESEAVIIREMAARVLGGEGLEYLAAELNERKIWTAGAPCLQHRATTKERCPHCGRWKPEGKRGADGTWSATKLRSVLLNEQNVGDVTHHNVVVSTLPGDPILDRDTYIDLEAFFAARRTGRPAKYICTGFVVCGRCSSNLQGHMEPLNRAYADGTRRRSYECPAPRAGISGGCGRMTIDARGLEKHVRELVARVMADPAHASAIENAARFLDDARNRINDKIRQIDELLDTFADRLGNEEIKLERYDRIAGPQEIRRAELVKQLERLEEPEADEARRAASVDSEEEWLARWDAATVDGQRALLSQALGGRVLVVNTGRPMPRFNPDRVSVGRAPVRRKAKPRRAG